MLGILDRPRRELREQILHLIMNNVLDNNEWREEVSKEPESANANATVENYFHQGVAGITC